MRRHTVRKINTSTEQINERSTEKHRHPPTVRSRNQRGGQRPAQNPRYRRNGVADGERGARVIRSDVHVITQMSGGIASRQAHGDTD